MGIGSSSERRQSLSHRPLRIAVIGDVHGAWDKAVDEIALRFLDPDLVLFVGDFGDGAVHIVRDVSCLNMPKAVILGNHDCFGAGPSNKMKQLFDPASIKAPCSIKEQLKALGDSHVGFARKDFPPLKLSVVGGRPFSAGGPCIFNPGDCESIYGVKDMKESAEKIVDCAMEAPKEHLLVFLGHNGPKGLGSQASDICGMDFTKEGGDNGDEDLEEAITRCEGLYRIPLVVFGHMHKQLYLPSDDDCSRMMVKKCGETVYVNAAVVPRHRQNSTQRNFTLVELQDGKVTEVRESWVHVSPWPWPWRRASLAQHTVLYSAPGPH